MFDVLKNGHYVASVWRGWGAEPIAETVRPTDCQLAALAGWESGAEIASWVCAMYDLDPYACEFFMIDTGEIVTFDDLLDEGEI